jgi:site-specific DNA recombinase
MCLLCEDEGWVCERHPDKVADRIKVLEAERDTIRAALATAAPSDIALHPASIERYAADIASLGSIGESGDPELAVDLVEKLRRLILEVIVHAPPGSDELAVEIKGRLAELTGAGSFVKRSGRGVKGGSGGGTRTPDPRIMIPVL